jgi:DNA-directed RNA polymerase subunit L
MDPEVLSKDEENEILKFRITNINVSLINALRRVIINDIPCIVFKTAPYKESDCTIQKNTSRFNNEMIKHRLSLVPIHLDDLSIPLENYLLEVKKKNESETIEFITTEDFKIKDVNTGKYLSNADHKKIFPPNKITGDFIDFVRLRPKLATNIDGEELHLTCKFSIHTAKEDASYNVQSKCFYINTVDQVRQNDEWSKKEAVLKEDGLSEDNIKIEKKNWYLLDGLRIFKPNTYDFKLKSIGVFENNVLIKKGCNILVEKCNTLIESIDTNSELVEITDTISTIPNCYDIKLMHEDFTIGKVIEYFLFTLHYEGSKTLDYCGFQKKHPHDDYCIIRLAFKIASDQAVVRQLLKESLNKSMEIFKIIEDQF